MDLRTGAKPGPDTQPATADEVLAHLDRISCSTGFVRAERLRRFLRHVLEKRLAGDPDGLKEYAIGVAVFDRDPGYDPRIDPIVRVEANRLRAKLREYYETEGREDPVRIQFEKGSYAPVITRPEAGAAGPSAPPAAAPAAPAPGRAGRLWIGVLAALALALAAWNLVLHAQLGAHRDAERSLAQQARTFQPVWGSFLTPGADNHAVIGSPMFFTDPTTAFFYRFVGLNDIANLHANADFREMQRRFGAMAGPRYDYAEVGDALALQRVTAFLARFGAGLKGAPAHQTSWDAIKGGNILFLGPARLDKLITRLPATPDFEVDAQFDCLNRNPRPGEPAVYRSVPGRMYAVVSRFPGLQAGRDILLISSHSSPGTLGAADFLLQPDTVSQLVRQAGLTAADRRFDVVLRVYIDKEVPFKAEYVAHHSFRETEP